VDAHYISPWVFNYKVDHPEQGSECCAYGNDGMGTDGYDCVIIPGASSATAGFNKPIDHQLNLKS
jgi:hypothetical protein